MVVKLKPLVLQSGLYLMKYSEAMRRKKLTTSEKVKITKKMEKDTLIRHYKNSICSEK